MGGGKSNTTAEAYSSPVSPFLLSGTLLRLFLLSCPPQHMGRAIDLLNCCELVLSVHQRLEGSSSMSPSPWQGVKGGCGEGAGAGGSGLSGTQDCGTPQHGGVATSSIKTSLRTTTTTARSHDDMERGTNGVESGQQVQIGGHTFMRDGVLMSPGQVWGPLLLFLMEEVKRRQMRPSDTQTGTSVSQDVEKLVGILQRTENHLLAIRVLLTSWSAFSSKKQVLVQYCVEYCCSFRHLFCLVLCSTYQLPCWPSAARSCCHCILTLPSQCRACPRCPTTAW